MKRICMQCHHIEDTETGDYCPRCLGTGHCHPMRGAGEFERSREIWRTHFDPEVVAVSLAAIDRAESVLSAHAG